MTVPPYHPYRYATTSRYRNTSRERRLLLDMTEMNNQIHQLQQQQALTVAALAALIQGRSVGADSLEAFLYAIDPSLQGTLQLDPPVSESQLEETLPKE